MTGDTQDMTRRIRAVLPQGWFGDETPGLDAVLSGFGAGLAALYTLIQFVIAQSRLVTATGNYIDGFATDFFGATLGRRLGESDTSYRTRVMQALLEPRATRAALTQAVTTATGRAPVVFEPARPSDTGGYTLGGTGYGCAGGWGNLQMPYQIFISVYRPGGGAIAALAGYGTGGVPAYADLAADEPGPTDADLYAAIPPLLPAATTAWCRLLS